MNPDKQNQLENVLQEIASVQKELFALNTRLGNLSLEVLKLSEPEPDSRDLSNPYWGISGHINYSDRLYPVPNSAKNKSKTNPPDDIL